MKFVLVIIFLIVINGIKCCQKQLDIPNFEAEKMEVEKLVVEVEQLETKIDELQTNGVVPPNEDTSTNVFKMMAKEDCTKEIVGNRKIACGDLDQISSCTCKTGKQYSSDEKFTEDCKVEFCTCLNSSVVKLFGLHRALLSCIAI